MGQVYATTLGKLISLAKANKLYSTEGVSGDKLTAINALNAILAKPKLHQLVLNPRIAGTNRQIKPDYDASNKCKIIFRDDAPSNVTNADLTQSTIAFVSNANFLAASVLHEVLGHLAVLPVPENQPFPDFFNQRMDGEAYGVYFQLQAMIALGDTARDSGYITLDGYKDNTSVHIYSSLGGNQYHGVNGKDLSQPGSSPQPVNPENINQIKSWLYDTRYPKQFLDLYKKTHKNFTLTGTGQSAGADTNHCPGPGEPT